MAVKQAERRLSEDQVRQILLAAPMGVIVMDSEGQIVDNNLRTERMFGYDEGELLGKAIEVLVPDRIRPGHPALRDSFFVSPTARMMGAGRDLRGLRKDGHEFPVEIGLSPVTGKGVVLAAAYVIDVSERKKQDAQRLYEEIQELSVPILSVWEGVLVLPLVGTLDSHRAQDAMEKALTRMADQSVKMLIVDITGVPVVDTMVANHLLRMATAVRLMGGEAILTGISPVIARTIVQLGVDLSGLNTRSSLAQGLQFAIGQMSGESRNGTRSVT